MTGTAWLVTVFLAAAAVVVAWPLRSSRTRRHDVLGSAYGRSRGGGARWGLVRAWARGSRVGHAVDGRHGGRFRAVERPLPTGPPGRRDPARPGRAPRSAPAPDRPAGARLADPISARPAGARVAGWAPGGPTSLLLADPASGRPDVRHSDSAASRPDRGLTSGAATASSVQSPLLGPARDGCPGEGRTGISAVPDGAERPAGRARWQFLVRSPRRSLLLAAVLGAGAGAVLAGPVTAVILAAYTALSVRAVLRRQTLRRREHARRRSLDQLCALAADLRAGLPVMSALNGARPDVTPPEDSTRITDLARAAVSLADRTGAPLADLLDRIEADARAADRGLAAAAAQAAGARATAWLLAALPLGGIGLGYGIGVDPVSVLLHTPIGGGSAVVAVALQTGGLLWAERLGASPGPGVD